MKLEAIKALVVGMEKSGQATAAFLRARGADVTTTDIKPLNMPAFVLNPTRCSRNRGISSFCLPAFRQILSHSGKPVPAEST